MVDKVIHLLEDAKRYFDNAGMYAYRMTNIEIFTENWIRVTLVEISPSGKESNSFSLDFSNGNGYLAIEHSVTEEDVYDYADEFGWDEETIQYIRYGTFRRKK